MLTIKNWNNLSLIEQQEQLKRPLQQSYDQDKSAVEAIISAVKERGDEAVVQLTKQFDKARLSTLTVSPEKIAQAQISAEAERAIAMAIQTVTLFHKEMMPESKQVQTAKGVVIRRIIRPIQKVGLYVPAGNNTPLISSVLMQAIPALIAGCPIRVLCTPPNAEGNIDPHLLVAARLCQIEKIYTVGGAQAIAAMAYGTESIRKVDKIFGPGNRYVTEAKTQVSIDPFGAAIDMPAGPSELMIIADEDTNPAYVAADLLSQAEHGIDSQVFLICESVSFAEAVNVELAKQFQLLKRQTIMQQSLAGSAILICADRAEILKIINDYAPEHLIINCAEANSWVEKVNNAGTIFLGPWAAESLGDYVTGSNHILPTYGFARNYSGLSTRDFLKTMSVQSISHEGIMSVGEAAYTLAMMEGLDAHANAIRQRIILQPEG